MNKVTYEKAEKAIKNANYFIAGFASNAFYRISYDDMRTIEDFIDQHRPPTLEEIVEYWTSYVSTNLIVYIEDNVFYVRDTDDNYQFIMTYDIENGYYEFRATELCEVNAINLTMRYLESLKEKEHDNT